MAQPGADSVCKYKITTNQFSNIMYKKFDINVQKVINESEAQTFIHRIFINTQHKFTEHNNLPTINEDCDMRINYLSDIYMPMAYIPYFNDNLNWQHDKVT